MLAELTHSKLGPWELSLDSEGGITLTCSDTPNKTWHLNDPTSARSLLFDVLIGKGDQVMESLLRGTEAHRMTSTVWTPSGATIEVEDTLILENQTVSGVRAWLVGRLLATLQIWEQSL